MKTSTAAAMLLAIAVLGARMGVPLGVHTPTDETGARLGARARPKRRSRTARQSSLSWEDQHAADLQRRAYWQRLQSRTADERAAASARWQARKGKVAAARAAIDCCSAPSDDYREAGNVYRRWTPGTGYSWQDARRDCWAESQAAAARGDYSRPADRICALGKMHQHKQAAWHACRAACAQRDEADPVTYYEHGMMTVLEIKGTGSASYYPDGGVWALDYKPSGARRASRVGTYDDATAAHDAARAVLLGDGVPF